MADKLSMSPQRRRWMEAIGFVVLVLSIIFFNKSTAWPGWRAILPVVAAVLVLLANRSSVWTSGRLTQWLGDRSYSLYLWHWPVVVALTYLSLNENPLVIACALLLTIVLGHLSFLWVENTSREWLARRYFGGAATALAIAAAAVALPAFGVWKQQGVAGRFAPATELAAAEINNRNSRLNECHQNNGVASPSCVYGGVNWKVIALGDSHADAVVTGLTNAYTAGEAGVVQWSYSGCPFVPGHFVTSAKRVDMGGDRFKCSEFLHWVGEKISNLPASIPVVLINRYAEAAFSGNEERLAFAVPKVYFSKLYPHTTPEFLSEFSHHITESACKLAKQRTVYMVRPIPEMGFDVPRQMSRRMALGFKDDLSISVEDYEKRNAWVWAAQDKAQRQCGIKILDPTPYLCREGRCYGSISGRPLYVDDDHLSEFGNKLLVPMFAEVFKAL